MAGPRTIWPSVGGNKALVCKKNLVRIQTDGFVAGRVCVRPKLRVAMRMIVLMLLFVLIPNTACALDGIAVDPLAERTILSDIITIYDVDGRTLTLGGRDGDKVVQVTASPGNMSPGWFAFALTNVTDEQLIRWLVVENTGSADSGIINPILIGPRLVSVQSDKGKLQPVLESGRLDIFEIEVDAGQTQSFVVETVGAVPRFIVLWDPRAYGAARHALSFFHGLIIGIVGLLAIFLTSLYVVRHRLMYPAAALIGWAGVVVLATDFGLWQRGFGAGPATSSVVRAIAEVIFVGAVAFLFTTFVEFKARYRYVADGTPVIFGVSCVLVLIAVLWPSVAVSIARLLSVVVAVCGIAAIGYLITMRSARALALVPSWIAFTSFTLLSMLVYSGVLSGAIAHPMYIAALGLVAMVISFTAMQYAFDADVAPDANARELALKAVAFSVSDTILWDWKVKEETITVGRELEEALGVARNSLNGPQQNWLDKVHHLDRDRFVQLANSAVVSDDGLINTEFRLHTSAVGQRWYRLRARSVAREGVDAIRFVGSLEDVTTFKNSRERLLRDAVHDSLTGLPNRALFVDRLTRAVVCMNSQGGNNPSVLVIDVDRFKNVSQGFGHGMGDSMLTVIAQRMSEVMSEADTLARIEADKFAAIVVSDASYNNIEEISRDLRHSLKQPFYVGGHEVFLTGSIGISTFDSQRHDKACDLLREAELAMVHAKTSGGDKTEKFHLDMHPSQFDRLTIESDFRRALERSELELLYQPIVSLNEERIAGFEVLMRWQHPEKGEISPDKFIEIAEEAGLIVELGYYALDAAAQQLSLWRKTFGDVPDLFVSVNVSSRQIFRQDLIRDARLISTSASIPAGAIKLAITESLVMENPELAAYVLERLREMGVGLLLDDFGAGYSALSHLQQFPFDTIKVDKSLVTGGRDNASVIVKSIVNMAHDLGMKVVAEGVDSPSDVAYLRGIGCDFGQGYHFSPPLHVNTATKYLAEWR